MKNSFHRPFFIRLFHWEYWSFGMVYVWTLPAWLFFCVRARSFFFFTASNPSIKNGGLIGESKKDIHAILPLDLYPKTIHFQLGHDPLLVLEALKAEAMQFPVIGKPDIGGKGRGVKMLRSEQDVLDYAAAATLDFHIQQYVDFPNEIGIFYYRFPGEERGHITGIVGKEFLTVTGNGKDTLQALLRNDQRSVMYIESLEKMHHNVLNEILAAGEKKIVSPYGNHARGAMFLDHSHLIDGKLEETVDAFCKRIPEFYFGRLDIRFKDMDQLREGKQFIVIEVNGAGAEPTHMYDPRHSIFFAWKEIIRHWNILEKISRMNHHRGVPYPGFVDGIRIFTKENEDADRLAKMPE